MEDTSLFRVEYGNPDAEQTDALSRAAAGEDDVGAQVARANFLTDPENLRLVLAIGQDCDEPVDEGVIVDLQLVYRNQLLQRVLGFLGNNGELPLMKGIQDLRTVITSAPKNTLLYQSRVPTFGILDKIEASLAEFTYPSFQPGEMPLTPEHIQSLRQLDVIPNEDLQKLLHAIHYYGSVINYGEPIEQPKVSLFEFQDSLRNGAFLQELLRTIATKNRIDLSLALSYVQRNVLSELIPFLVETAHNHQLEVNSFKSIHDVVTYALEDMVELVKVQKDLKSVRKHELMAAALSCILWELPESPVEELFLDEEFNEDGFPMGIEEEDQDEYDGYEDEDRGEDTQYLPPIEWK
jgi:hypothetical protein